MSKKSSNTKHAYTRPTKPSRRQTRQPEEKSLGFGPDRRTEHLSYRDPEEPTQGPLRFDETNYSVERLALREGGYNEYADEISADDEERRANQAQTLQYPDATQNDLLENLPPADVNLADVPNDADLGFLLTAEDLEASPDSHVDRDAEKLSHYSGQTARRGTRTDELIREDIYEALDSRADIDAPDISLHVRGGRVTIEGEVADAMVRHRVEQCVDSVDGVKDINNRLHLAATQPRRPWSDE